jgi:hypothetical protein
MSWSAGQNSQKIKKYESKTIGFAEDNEEDIVKGHEAILTLTGAMRGLDLHGRQ